MFMFKTFGTSGAFNLTERWEHVWPKPFVIFRQNRKESVQNPSTSPQITERQHVQTWGRQFGLWFRIVSTNAALDHVAKAFFIKKSLPRSVVKGRHLTGVHPTFCQALSCLATGRSPGIRSLDMTPTRDPIHLISVCFFWDFRRGTHLKALGIDVRSSYTHSWAWRLFSTPWKLFWRFLPETSAL